MAKDTLIDQVCPLNPSPFNKTIPYFSANSNKNSIALRSLFKLFYLFLFVITIETNEAIISIINNTPTILAKSS